jgi:hypothetical protein
MIMKTQNDYYNPFPWRSIAFLISVLALATLSLFLWITDVQASEETHTLPPGDFLYDIWGNSANDVFAVGKNGTILHYDSDRWMSMSRMTNKSLQSVWSNASDNVFVVGEDGIILHYDGFRWTEMTSGTTNTLSSIWGSANNNIYAVGDNGTMLHYDGNQWMTINSPTANNLLGIWGRSENDILAVGENSTIIHYDGSQWTANDGERNPNFSLVDVWATENQWFVVGEEGTILHHDGSQWTTSNTSNNLNSLFGMADNNVFAVGSQGTILQYDGIEWTVHSSNTNEHLFGIWGTASDNLLIVGDNGTILHYDENDWTHQTLGWVAMESGTTNSLNAVWGHSDNEIFAVGGWGTILHYDGNQWTTMDSGTTSTLYDIFGLSENHRYAVGSSGTILHHDGAQWTAMDTGIIDDLLSIWGSGPNNIYAVGENDAIVHYDGTQWTKLSINNIEETVSNVWGTSSVWGTSANDIFMMTIGWEEDVYETRYYNSTISHYDGNNWTHNTISDLNYLEQISGSSPQNILAVGSFGQAFHYDGSEWTIFINNEYFDWLMDVWTNSNDNAFIVSNYGRIFYYDGNRWTAMITRPSTSLNGVWGIGNKTFAVGNNGTILQFDNDMGCTLTIAPNYDPEASRNDGSCEYNQVPVLAPIGNQTVTQGQTLNFTATATDAENDPLAFSLIEAPVGAEMDADTGLFNWVPENAGDFELTVMVSELGTPSSTLTDQETITLTVERTNTAPIINSMGPQTVEQGETLNLTATATDAENDSFIFSLRNAPETAEIDANTGEINWTPTNVGDFNLTVVVTETNGIPSNLNAENVITITVTEPPPEITPVEDDEPAENNNESSDEETESTQENEENDEIEILPVDNDEPNDNETELTQADDDEEEIEIIPVDNDEPSAQETEPVDTTTDEIPAIIIAQPINTEPVLDFIGNKTIEQWEPLNFTTTATDAENDFLSYSLVNAPAGAWINSWTGEFSWEPVLSGTFEITVKVTEMDNDGNLSDLNAQRTIIVTVNEGQTIVPICTLEQMNLSYPTALNFGSDVLNTPRSQTLTMRFERRENVDVDTCHIPQIDSLEFTGLHASEFSLTYQECYNILNDNVNCDLTVAFTPTAIGNKEAELSITLADVSEAISPITLQAEVVPDPISRIEVSPNAIDFATIKLGEEDYQEITITNTGNTTVTFDTIDIAGTNSSDFWVEYWDCYRLQPSEECYVDLILFPNSSGNKHAELVINSTAPTTKVSLTATVEEREDCSGKNITVKSSNSGLWNLGSVWDTGTIPGENDVVKIQRGHTITASQQLMTVKALCIEEGGLLESWDNQGTALKLNAKDVIENKGTIQGKNGANEKNATVCTNEWNVGDFNCPKPGASISLETLFFKNEGTITAGHGGQGTRYSASGGNIHLIAPFDDYYYDYYETSFVNSGILRAGNGGNITGIQPGKAGIGGGIEVWDYFIIETTTNMSIYAGDGGNCNGAIEQIGGDGGQTLFMSWDIPDIQGMIAAGLGGTNCERDGFEGELFIEPHVISLKGANTKVTGGNIAIYGGEDWVLDLSNLTGPVVKATGDITLAVGDDGIIDLRGSTGPILQAQGNVYIYADNVMLDQGVRLSDLIQASAFIRGPNKILYNVSLMADNKIMGMPGSTISVPVTIGNAGPKKDTYTINVTDSAGWLVDQLPQTIEVEGLRTADLEIEVMLPTTANAMDIITVTTTSQNEASATTDIKVIVRDSTKTEPWMLGLPLPTNNPCPITGWIDEMCNNHGQRMTDATLGPNANIAGGQLAGTINSQGLMSQLTIESEAIVSGGKITGYIINQGTLADFEFVGGSITGGILAGTIYNNSEVGGSFNNVQLAANTKIIGGTVAGHIQGDCEAPAQLENVTVKADSQLTCVTVISDQLPVISEQSSEDMTESDELPQLIDALAVNAKGEITDSEAQFSGGIAINQDPFEEMATTTLSDGIDIRGRIEIATEHRRKIVDSLVVVAYQPEKGKGEREKEKGPVFLMLDENGDILPWDFDMASLVTFQTVDTPTDVIEVPIYQGQLPATGIINIYFGYRLNNGTVVYSPQTLDIIVNEANDE